jgi:predicted GNAT superfamily acetyltransferase
MERVALIRDLLPADGAQLLELNSSAQPNVAALDRAELSRLRALSRLHRVAAEGDVVLGYALAFATDDAYDGEEFVEFRARIAQPFVYVDQVAVRLSARGTGLGRLLYESLEQSAQERGAACLCCEVNTAPPNPGSLSFHRRLAFSELGALATQDGRNVVLLKKDISRGG